MPSETAEILFLGEPRRLNCRDYLNGTAPSIGRDLQINKISRLIDCNKLLSAVLQPDHQETMINSIA